MKKIYLKDIIWVVYVFYLFTIIAWGDRIEYFKYSNITFVVLSALMVFYIAPRISRIPSNLFLFLPFLLFSFASISWSVVPDDTLTKSITLARLFLLLVIMAFYLYVTDDTRKYIYGIAVAGVLVLLYVISFYGFAGLRQMIDGGLRVGEEFVNSNTLAIYLSFSALIFLYLFIQKKKWYYIILTVAFSVVIASTGSKKGVLDLIVGILAMVSIQSRSEHGLSKIGKWFFRLGVLSVGLYILWQSPFFTTIRYRVELMTGFLTGTGTQKDYSTLERQIMMRIGLEQFFKKPILGIGIDASSSITRSAVGYGTYLHNDYIELLACGGIVGFLTEYIPIVIVFIKNWKKRAESEICGLCALLLIVYMVNGIAAVQYFSKICYVIFAISLSSYLFQKNEKL